MSQMKTLTINGRTFRVVSPTPIASITLRANAWVGNSSPYSQVVPLVGITENSQINLTPTVDQIAIFYEKDITFVTENAGGILTVYVFGQKPTNDYTIPADIVEVEHDGPKIYGIPIATPINPDKLPSSGNASDEQIAAAVDKYFTKNPASGLTTAQINALDGLFKIAAYTEDASSAYAAFLSAFGLSGGGETPDNPVIPDEPEKTLTSISAVYSGGDVTAGTAVTDLTGVVVTAHYSDGTSETVTGYTLSGTIAEGSNTVTVTYQGKTATFVVDGIAESGGNNDAIVYNVFDGEYEGSGYSGALFDVYGSATNVYKTKIDLTNADKLYMRLAKTLNAKFAIDNNVQIGVYASDDTLLGVIPGSDATVADAYQPLTPNVGYGVIETLEDGTEIHTKGIASISLSDYPTKAYARVACKLQSMSRVALSWKGNAQSTSPLTLEGWV